MKRLFLTILILIIVLIGGCTNNVIHPETPVDKSCSVDSDCKIMTSGYCGPPCPTCSITSSYACVNINESYSCDKTGFNYYQPPMGCVCDKNNNTCKVPENNEEYNRLYNIFAKKCEKNETQNKCYYDMAYKLSAYDLNRTVDFCKITKYPYDCFSGISDFIWLANQWRESIPQEISCRESCPECSNTARKWCLYLSLMNYSNCDNLEGESKNLCYYGLGVLNHDVYLCDKIDSEVISKDFTHSTYQVSLKDDCYYSFSFEFEFKDYNFSKTLCSKISNKDLRDNCYELRDVSHLYKCTNAGGSVKIQLCCKSVIDYPDTCSIGACGCSPDNSHEVTVCDCGEGRCWDTENGCVSR